MSVKASLPPLHSGHLIDSLVETVDGAAAAMRAQSGPTLILKQDGRNYLRLTELPPQAELHCSNVDCHNAARLSNLMRSRA